jgi:hypothetical protein
MTTESFKFKTKRYRIDRKINSDASKEPTGVFHSLIILTQRGGGGAALCKTKTMQKNEIVQ